MFNKSSYKMDIVNGPLLKNMVLYALPLMATFMLQMLFSAADTIVVGKFAGEIPLAAVGSTSSLIFMFTVLFNGLATGTNVLVAKEIGANNKDGVKKAVHTSLLVGIFGGLIISILSYFLCKPALMLMNTPLSIIDHSTTYMRIYLSGSIFIFEYNFGAAILRAKGDTKRPLYYLLISGLINVILNLVFVVAFNMEVKGVALATVISQVVSCFLVIRSLINDNDMTRINIEDLKFNPYIFLEILKIGIPAAIQGAAFSLTNLVVQSAINSFDSSTIVAGNTAALNIENFIYIGIEGFTIACVTFTSQCIGANRKDRILPIFTISMILNTICAFSIGFIAYTFGDFFLSLYTNDLYVIEIGKLRLYWVGVFLFLNGCLDVFSNSLRGMGHTVIPAAIMMFGIIAVRIFWIYNIFPMFNTLESIYQCFPVSWLVTCLIDTIFYIVVYNKEMNS